METITANITTSTQDPPRLPSRSPRLTREHAFYDQRKFGDEYFWNGKKIYILENGKYVTDDQYKHHMTPYVILSSKDQYILDIKNDKNETIKYNEAEDNVKKFIELLVENVNNIICDCESTDEESWLE